MSLDVEMVSTSSHASSARSGAPPSPGPDLDREIERRVFGRESSRPAPPFSTEDWTASTMAELVARRTGWTFDVMRQDGVWSAMWIERPQASAGPKRRVLSLVTATAPTRPLAICRALLRAAGSPRWPSGALNETRWAARSRTP